MPERDAYRGLADWLSSTWWQLTESENLLPLLKSFYTPEEAELLIDIPFLPAGVDELSALKGVETGELAARLDALARKGAVWRSPGGATLRYALNDTFFVFLRGFFSAGRTDAASLSLAPLVNRYVLDGWFDQYSKVQSRGLRTIPIEGTIRDERTVRPYEDVVKVLAAAGFFALSTCACKHRKNLDPGSPSCSYPTEVCLHLDGLGRYMVQNGMGREIAREEAERILVQAAEAGLVHAVSNWTRAPDTICNCCRCCCVWFESFHRLAHPRSVDPSSQRIRTGPDTCIGCGLCEKRCPMGALRMADRPEAKGRITIVEGEAGKKGGKLENKKGRISELANPERCLGCGVCAYKCPTRSLVLEACEAATEPPEGMMDYLMRYMTERMG